MSYRLRPVHQPVHQRTVSWSVLRTVVAGRKGPLTSGFGGWQDGGSQPHLEGSPQLPAVGGAADSPRPLHLRARSNQPFGAHWFRVHPPRGATVATRRHSFQTFLPSGWQLAAHAVNGSRCDLKSDGVAVMERGSLLSRGLVWHEPAAGGCGCTYASASSRLLKMSQADGAACKAAVGPAAAAPLCFGLDASAHPVCGKGVARKRRKGGEWYGVHDHSGVPSCGRFSG